MSSQSLSARKIVLARNATVFLIFYLCFFLYQNLAIYDNLVFLLFINISILAIFFLTFYSSRLGLYIFIFFIPLFNSLTTILKVHTVPIILFFFFAFFMIAIYLVFEYKIKNLCLSMSLRSNFFILLDFVLLLLVGAGIKFVVLKFYKNE